VVTWVWVVAVVVCVVHVCFSSVVLLFGGEGGGNGLGAAASWPSTGCRVQAKEGPNGSNDFL
jgi:hypothetical protein